MEKIRIKNGGIVATDHCEYYDAHLLIIDTDEKTIEVSDTTGFSNGLIHYEDEKEITVLTYDEDGRIEGEQMDIIKNGDLAWQQ